ncbi:MAG TPA: GntR family transcriptional regulator [bacterium]|nr:GntR family transcriptional regulator [bacterium]
MSSMTFGRVPARRLGDLVYESLVEAIASGRVPDGSKLYEDEIARQMGVSKTPVREALRHLAKDGLVEADLHRTPMVRALTRQDIDEIYRVREYLEPLVVRLVTERPGGPQFAELLALQEGMEARFSDSNSVDLSGSVQYNQAFHRALVAASGSERLRAIMEPLWAQFLRLSFLSHRTYRLPGKQARAISEHRGVLEAIRAGDAPRGEQLMREHIRRGHGDLVSSLPKDGEIDGNQHKEAAMTTGAGNPT